MGSRLDDFQAYREKMNEKILASDHVGIKRFFRLDGAAYEDGRVAIAALILFTRGISSPRSAPGIALN